MELILSRWKIVLVAGFICLLQLLAGVIAIITQAVCRDTVLSAQSGGLYTTVSHGMVCSTGKKAIKIGTIDCVVSVYCFLFVLWLTGSIK